MDCDFSSQLTASYAAVVANSKTILEDDEKEEFLDTHSAGIYFSLKEISDTVFAIPVTGTEILKHTIDFDTAFSQRNYCMACMQSAHGVEHLLTPQHARAIAAQQFRLNAHIYKLEAFQKWIMKHGFGKYHNITDGWNMRVDFQSFQSEQAQAMLHHGKLCNQGSNIPLLVVDAVLSEIRLDFELQYKEFPEKIQAARIVPTMCDEDGYVVHSAYMVQPHLDTIRIPCRFSSNTPGIKYYTVQFWVIVDRVDGKPVTYPLCCEIRCNWRCPDFDNAINTILKTVPSKDNESAVGVPLSTLPDREGPERRDQTRRVMNREVRPLPLDHASNTPFFEAWGKVSIPANASVQKQHQGRDLRCGDCPDTSLESVGIDKLIDISTPVTKDNVIDKNHSEVICQVQHEENSPTPTETLGIKFTEQAEIRSDDINIQEDRDGLYVTTTLKTSAFVSMNAAASTRSIRMIHPGWRAKYAGTIAESYPDHNPDLTHVILKFNNGMRHQLEEFFHSPYQNRIPPTLIPIVSPAHGYILGFYELLKRKKTSNKPTEPTPEPMEIEGASADVTPKQEKIQKENSKEWYENRISEMFEETMNYWFTTNPEETVPDKPPRDIPEELQKHMEWLDDKQRVVWKFIIERIRLIACEAPPGSGKSRIIAGAVALLHAAFPEEHILCLAPTNAGANVIGVKVVEGLKAIFDDKVPPKSVLRYVRAGYPAEELGALYPYSSEALAPGVSANTIFSHKILIQTCDLAIMNNLNNRQLITEEGKFKYSLVIIDEAASVDFPRLSLLMMLGSGGQTVFLGDTQQLPAYITSKKLQLAAGDESGMQIQGRLMKITQAGKAVSLENNYRSITPIVQPVNRVIYTENPMVASNHIDLMIQIHEQDRRTNGEFKKYLFPSSLIGGVSLLHVEGIMKSHGNSLYNAAELFAINKVIYRFMRCGVREEDIGVDCTYAAQTALARYLNSNHPKIRIGCANTWQGNERDYMIISLVRSDAYYDTYANSRNFGFLEDMRRLNVSTTRARKGNILICNALRFLHHPLVAEILREVCQNGSWISDPITLDAINEVEQMARYTTPWAVRQIVHYKICESFPRGPAFPAKDDRKNEPEPATDREMGGASDYRCCSHLPQRVPVNHVFPGY